MEYGHIDVLKWLKANGYPWNPSKVWCERAAVWGDLGMLQYLRLNGAPWDQQTANEACSAGHIHILQWCQSSGCPMYRVSDLAAEESRIDVLAWCRDNYVPWDSVTFSHTHDVGVAEWLRANGCPWDAETAAQAGRHGNIDMLDWCKMNHCPFDSRVWFGCEGAREYTYNPVFQWCEDNGWKPKIHI